jgi:hypothetical protein
MKVEDDVAEATHWPMYPSADVFSCPQRAASGSADDGADSVTLSTKANTDTCCLSRNMRFFHVVFNKEVFCPTQIS